MSSLRSSAASGVFWMAAQAWVMRLTTAGAFIILSRQLQPTDFGLIALAMAVIGVLSLFGESGISTYVVRTQDLDQRALSTAFWTTVGLSGAIAAGLFLFAAPVAGLFDEPGLVPVLRWLTLGLVLAGLASIPSAVLKREMRFRVVALRSTTATLVSSVVAITMALTGYGVWALVAQSLVRSGLVLLLIATAVRWLPGLTWSPVKAREMIGFGSKLLTIGLLTTARDRGEDFVLAGVGGTSTLGLWTVANRLVRIIQEVGGSAINAVSTSAYARLQGDLPRLHRAYSTGLATAGTVLWPSLLLLSVTSPDLVPLLLGEQWRVTAQVAQVVTITSAVATFSYFDRAIFIAVDRLRPEMALVTASVLLQLTVVVVFAPLGLMPLALALLARACVIVPVRMKVLHDVTGVPFRAWAKPGRVFLAALGMAAVVQVVLLGLGDVSSLTRCLVAVAVAGVVYPLLLWLVARPVLVSLLDDARALRRRRVPVTPDPAGADEQRQPVDSAL